MRVLDEDIVRVFGARYDRFTRETRKNKVIHTFYWGDEVDLVEPEAADDPAIREVEVRVYHPGLGKYQTGVIRKKADPKSKSPKRYLPFRWRTGATPHLLEVTFIDVQQGDATLIRTPDRKTVLVDGGEGKFIARLMAALFPGTTADAPMVVDALVVTHGDADHFYGLVELARAHEHKEPRKHIHARVARYYHNGLVKAGGRIVENGHERRRREYEKLGADYQDEGGRRYVAAVYDDPRDAAEMNEPFTEWRDALGYLLDPDGLQDAPRLGGESLPRVERLEFGDDAKFSVFAESGLSFQVLSPLVDTVNGQPMLAFLRGENGGLSAGHTINGHSVVLRLQYNNVRFMLGGDLNTYAEERLCDHVAQVGGMDLSAEVLKVPHHGSAEFDTRFLDEVRPVVSVVSSGDENAMKEYVHPRANLMAALGRYSRGPLPLVFSTELAAFFAYRGPIQPETHKTDGKGRVVELPEKQRRGVFHAFQRLIFGAVRARTDGERLLVAVESANDGIKEAYAFRISDSGDVQEDEWSLL